MLASLTNADAKPFGPSMIELIVPDIKLVIKVYLKCIGTATEFRFDANWLVDRFTLDMQAKKRLPGPIECHSSEPSKCAPSLFSVFSLSIHLASPTSPNIFYRQSTCR
jgi:hypothetical protein